MTGDNLISKNTRQTTAFSAALLLVFNLLFFAPVEIFLGNVRDLSAPIKYVLWGCVPLSAVMMILLYFILYKVKDKHFYTAISVVWGLGLAFYIQGNFLQINSAQLDGTEQRAGAVSCIINLLIWLVILAVPHLIQKFKRDIFPNAVNISSLAIVAIEVLVLILGCWQAAENDVDGRVIEMLSGDNYDYYLSQDDQYEFSTDHNIILILTDEYDSFCFEKAVKNDPQAAEGFKDFTFYSNTIGVFGGSSPSITNIFTGSHTDLDFSNDTLFRTLDSNGYITQLFTSKEIFSHDIFMKYADNCVEYSFGAKDLMNLDKCIYSLAFYKYMPVILKEPFHLGGADINRMTSSSDAYYRVYDYNNLAFYNTIGTDVTYTDSKCFKYIYLFGLHPVRTTSKDLIDHGNTQVSKEECAEAVNKILCAYLEKLRENGVYDNSDIIIMADHGCKDNDWGKYPTLLIKRSGESFDKMNVSDVPVSYDDMYPTLLYLAGDESADGTVFDLKEGERTRYFAQTDEYITGPVTR